jgi:hypothetical protein
MDLEARSRRLTEDDVADSLAVGEGDQAVGWSIGFDAHDRGTETLGQGDVAGESVPVSRLDSTGASCGVST